MPSHVLRHATAWAAAVLVLGAGVAPAQPNRRGETTNSAEQSFAPFRLEASPAPGQALKLNQMKSGTLNIDPPTADDQAVLAQMAKSYVYPVTHHENYFLPDGPELVTRSLTAPSIPRVLANYRAQLLFATPGVQPAPTQLQLAYVREFGAALVSAIDDVLKKGPPAPIRINALRMLVMVAETGAPAAFDKAIALLKQKDEPNLSADQLYYAIKTAEAALAAYDRQRGNAWTSKNQHFELVRLVDDLVQKVPDHIIGKTYIPERPFDPTLTTDAKAPGEATAKNPGVLTPEQVTVAQVYRLQAVRALARVRTDVVSNETLDQERRPLYTLARVAVSDPALTPIPSVKEIGEALLGIANMMPSDSIHANAYGVVIAKGVSDFVLPKVSGGRLLDEDAVQQIPWKLYGSQLKAAFADWEKAINSPTLKIARPEKDMLIGLSQVITTSVFDPLSRQTESGQANIDKSAIDNWMTEKWREMKATGAPDLYLDKSTYKIDLSRQR